MKWVVSGRWDSVESVYIQPNSLYVENFSLCYFFFLGYGVYLAEIIMNQSYDLALRQLACVMLTKYVEDHWGVSESPVASAAALQTIANDQAKQMIRKILPNGLYDPNSKIRASVAYTISTIASMDWPHTWTDLFDIIVKCLGGNEVNRNHIFFIL